MSFIPRHPPSATTSSPPGCRIQQAGRRFDRSPRSVARPRLARDGFRNNPAEPRQIDEPLHFSRVAEGAGSHQNRVRQRESSELDGKIDFGRYRRGGHGFWSEVRGRSDNVTAAMHVNNWPPRTAKDRPSEQTSSAAAGRLFQQRSSASGIAYVSKSVFTRTRSRHRGSVRVADGRAYRETRFVPIH